MPDASARRFDRLVVVTLVVAVAALATAIWALVSSLSSDDSVTAEQSAEAKTHVCSAFDLVRDAVSLQTHAYLGDDPVAVQTVAANARLAALGGGLFLVSRNSDAVPAELADAVLSFADDLEYLGMWQLAGASADDPAQTARMNDMQAAMEQIAEMCQQ